MCNTCLLIHLEYAISPHGVGFSVFSRLTTDCVSIGAAHVCVRAFENTNNKQQTERRRRKAKLNSLQNNHKQQQQHTNEVERRRPKKENIRLVW